MVVVGHEALGLEECLDHAGSQPQQDVGDVQEAEEQIRDHGEEVMEASADDLPGQQKPQLFPVPGRFLPVLCHLVQFICDRFQLAFDSAELY